MMKKEILNMSEMRVTQTPQRSPICVFCKYWMGDAEIEIKRYGVEFEKYTKGPCMRRRGGETSAWYSCKEYSPSPIAEK